MKHVKLEVDADVEKIKALKEQVASDPAMANKLKSDPVSVLAAVGIKIDPALVSNAQQTDEPKSQRAVQAGFVHIDL